MLASGRIFDAEPGEHDEGVPDGMKVEMDGNLYVTGPKGIWLWNANGQHIGTITLPEQPANLAWGITTTVLSTSQPLLLYTASARKPQGTSSILSSDSLWKHRS